MYTRSYIIKKIDELIVIEDKEVFDAPSNSNIFYKPDVELRKQKIAGLKELKSQINESNNYPNDVPPSFVLIKIIREVVKKYPSLITGMRSRSKNLLENIAPKWNTYTSSVSSPASTSVSSIGIYNPFEYSKKLKDNNLSEYDNLFKIKVIGNSGVGKSSIILREVDDMFTESFISTLGVHFKQISINRNKLQIWDSNQYDGRGYRGAHAIIVVFDITNYKSFSDVEICLREIDRHADENVMRFLVANKADLTSERLVAIEDIKKFADQQKLPYIEVSAKTNENVQELFEYIASSLETHRNHPDKPRRSFDDYLKNPEGIEEEEHRSDKAGSCSIS